MYFTLKVADADKLYMTSDSHWGHFNICKYCHRPFTSRKEMDATLISNWNSVVPEDGIVVHCGDFMLPHNVGDKEYVKIWNKLNFHTLILCRGNHDRIECGTYNYGDKTVIVVDIAMILVEGIKIMACHYPMLSYPTDFQVFGHIHTLYDGTCYGIDGDVVTKLRKTQYDVGADQNNYTPVSYWQLVDIFRNNAKKSNIIWKLKIKLLSLYRTFKNLI
jgi:calcineurin-like phosphoesterase family protein